MGKRFGRWIVGAAALVCACAGKMDQEPSGRQASGLALGGFEGGDGNLDGTKDWANVPFAQKTDPTKGNPEPDNTTYPGGRKENDPVTGFTTDGIPPNKTDFTRFRVASEVANDHILLYLSFLRTSDQGDVNLDFEFNQAKNVVDTPIDLPPPRTAGDLLVTYDVAPGGVKLGLLKWRTVASPPTIGCFKQLDNNGNPVYSGAPPCWADRTDLNVPGVSEGAINEGTVKDVDGTTDIGPRLFGEAAIDLTAAGATDPNVCTALNTASAHSRSSESFDSTLQDYVGPLEINVTTCKPATVKIKKVADDGVTPLAGAEFALFFDADNDGVLDPDEDDEADKISPNTPSTVPPALSTKNCRTGADGIGNCIFTALTSGRYIALELIPPPGYLLPNPPTNSAVVTLTTDPNQVITITFNDALAPGTIVVEKKDDLGNFVGGVTFKLYKDNAPTGGSPGTGVGGEDLWPNGVPTPTCVTDNTPNDPPNDPNFGKCQFTSLAPGLYWVVEDTSNLPAGYLPGTETYKQVTVPVGSQPGQGGSVTVQFTNPRAFKVIVMVCRGDGTLYPAEVSFTSSTGATTVAQSISKTQAESAGLIGGATSVAESTLCGVTQAGFPGLRATPGAHPANPLHGATIDIH